MSAATEQHLLLSNSQWFRWDFQLFYKLASVQTFLDNCSDSLHLICIVTFRSNIRMKWGIHFFWSLKPNMEGNIIK